MAPRGKYSILKQRVTIQLKTLHRFVIEEDVEAVKSIFVNLSSLYSELITEHSERVLKLEDEDAIEEAEQLQEEVESRYLAGFSEAKQFIKDAENMPTEEKLVTTSPETAKLTEMVGLMNMPSLQLHKFKGDSKDYQMFKKSFAGCVKFSGDEDVKLTRLVASVEGEPYRLIYRCGLLESEGYAEAWRLLDQRYGDTDTVVQDMVTSMRRMKSVSSPSELRETGDLLMNNFAVLDSVGQLTEVNSQDYIKCIMEKMPGYMYNKWRNVIEKKIEKGEPKPNFKHMVDFVNKQADMANHAVYGTSTFGRADDKRDQKKPARMSTSYVNHLNVQHGACVFCKNTQHNIYKCPQFAAVELQGRLDFARKERLCNRCLKPNHIRRECKSTFVCTNCGGQHSTYLCYSQRTNERGADNNKQWVPYQQRSANNQQYVPYQQRYQNNYQPMQQDVKQRLSGDNNAKEESQDQRQQENKSASTVLSSVNNRPNINMPVVQVKVSDEVLNCVIDSASSVSFINRDVVDRHHSACVKKIKQINLQTMNGSKHEQYTVVDLLVHSTCEDRYHYMKNVMVVDKIPVVCNRVNIEDYPHLQGVQIMNENLSEVQILIGQDNAACILPLATRYGKYSEPFAVKTIFGWSLYGSWGNNTEDQEVSHLIKAQELNVSDDIHKMWEIEGANNNDTQKMSQDDDIVLSLWSTNTRRLGNGQYEVPIPVRRDATFPNNESVAVKRLSSLRNSLVKKGLYDRYDKEVQILIEEGYAEKVNETLLSETEHQEENRGINIWYLPHHGVTSEAKPDKLRIVFDAASVYHNESLNHKCYQGPDIVNHLYNVLLRFREYPYAATGDIKAMYYRVKCPVNQRNILRFLWFNSDGGMDIYRMTVHIFGGIWSQAAAIYALNKMADDEQQVSGVVKEVIKRDMYVDDCLLSMPDENSLKSTMSDVVDHLQKGGFQLTKIIMNCDEKDEKDHNTGDVKNATVRCVDKLDHNKTRALGIKWNYKTDSFIYEGELIPETKETTKRQVLSCVAKLFDPLGLLSPITIHGRLIFQECVRQKLDWDDKLPDDLQVKWDSWVNSVNQAQAVEIPRCMIQDDNATECELHYFGDASSVAYGVCCYVKYKDEKGSSHVRLLCSKSRITPVKAISIPRLELQAATLASELHGIVKSTLRLNIQSVKFWTDSNIVLGYLRNKEKKFQIYVANRVRKILINTEIQQWNHVGSKENVADIISRGLPLSDVWFDGPKFLYDDEYDDEESMKYETDVSNVVVDEPKKVEAKQLNVVDEVLSRCSSWRKMKRVMAWILRMGKRRIEDQLQPDELQRAECIIIKHIQKQCYGDKNALTKLSAYKDDEGVLRVGGRLSYATSIGNVHPIIIPGKSRVAEAIIQDTHSTAHVGKEWTLSLVRNKYWITRGRRVVSKVIRCCVICKKLYAGTLKQKMADLPEFRVQTSDPPFTYVGLDVFGPFYVKIGRSEVKRWVCLFTCAVTRAIHLEKINSLDANSFINAYRRFTARRGKPIMLISDNGTNFVGSEKELRQAAKEVLEKFQGHMTDNEIRIRWRFNPPYGSHWGGLFERQIRTTRRVMTGLLPRTLTLSDEVLDTVLCEAEYTVNSRPLTKVSEDSRDPVALTPNMLLMLKDSIILPACIGEERDKYRKRWKQVQYMADQFWIKYRGLYLSTLQERHKWKEEVENTEVDDLVMIVDINTPRNKWPLGVIEEVFKGRDDLVRSVRVRTCNGKYIRPISKIVMLESNTKGDNSLE